MKLCGTVCAVHVTVCDGGALVSEQVGERAVSVRDGIHWTTGGGFSNITGVLEWQSEAVSTFISKLWACCRVS